MENSEIVKEKIRSLVSLISTPAGHLNGGSKVVFPPELLISKIVNHITAEQLEQLSNDILREIYLAFDELLRAYVSRKRTENFVLKKIQIAGKFYIGLTIADRAFIVTTILEYVTRAGGKIRSLWHPVFDINEQKLSISLTQIDDLDEPAADRLIDDLRTGLNELINVTDDFEEVKKIISCLADDLNGQSLGNDPVINAEEVKDFLNWLLDGNFVLLGAHVSRGDYGLFKGVLAKGLLKEIKEVRKRSGNPEFFFQQTNLESPVHRFEKISAIVVADGSSEIKIFCGIFTSQAFSQEVATVPILRARLKDVFQKVGVMPNSHDARSISDRLNAIPLNESLQINSESLLELAKDALIVHDYNSLHFSFRADRGLSKVFALVTVPRFRFTNETMSKLQSRLEEIFEVDSDQSSCAVDIGNQPVVRCFFNLPTTAIGRKKYQRLDIERDLEMISKSWSELVLEKASARGLSAKVQDLIDQLPSDYCSLTAPDHAVEDLQILSDIKPEESLKVAFFDLTENEIASELSKQLGSEAVTKKTFCLKIYSKEKNLRLSDVFPLLTNCGFRVESQQSWQVQLEGSVHISRYLLSMSGVSKASELNLILREPLRVIIAGDARDDVLNKLLLSAGLSLADVELLRAYCAFTWQVSSFATFRTLLDAFAENPKVAKLFIKAFYLRFDPSLKLSLEERLPQAQLIYSEYSDALSSITDINTDRILRAYLTLLSSTVRTSFFATNRFVALKFFSEECPLLPNPRPKFEIFVVTKFGEGVHLRSDRVSRGGIRWSDRYQDYRSEILGLMKTQRIKNAVIVPSGAKGGFVIRQTFLNDPARVSQVAEEAYAEYIRALLSIADNKLNNKVVHPANCVVYDGFDPYFVVAADKGTATFSDIANKIAIEEYNFWLGDAFASGGSNGYDHKKYGITARGVWECVKRHFNDLGIDYINNSFTAVGIGDMSGDVFGNGMLLSKKMHLVAAFNHKHIFIDPNPDLEAAYGERQRLFRLPKSQWSDYDPKLISKGGGVYDRFAKQIKLSSEVRKVLGVQSDASDVVNGEELIRLILMAPVDLIWNGGIGTYFKASSETHPQVADSTNDRVRVDGAELRAKVVGEGGNLGFTQRARVEFARKGGKINTDAIDNSGGVDLSDHEVNLKLLFADLQSTGLLSGDERNKLLKSIDLEVCDKVLEHNWSQALVLAQVAKFSKKSLNHFQALIDKLAELKIINPRLEGLPNNSEFEERALKGEGLFVPELAICLAGVKMWIKDNLLESKIFEMPISNELLLDYFPRSIVERFKDKLLQHPLAKNIIASQFANQIGEILGITFLNRITTSQVVSPETALQAALIAQNIIDFNGARKALRILDTPNSAKDFIDSARLLTVGLRDSTVWLVSELRSGIDPVELVNLHKSNIHKLISILPKILVVNDRNRLQDKISKLQTFGLDQQLIVTMQALSLIEILYEISWAALRLKGDLQIIGSRYLNLLEFLDVADLLRGASSVQTRSKAEHELLTDSLRQIRRSVNLFMLRGWNNLFDNNAFERNSFALNIQRQARELRQNPSADVAALALFSANLRRVAESY
ncbi:MAG TPA: NAD-glutamate dehydrogenase [Oligoflexia bacterium]|nr:NAD-glutamate dehydrogenase [Oligoflexia bacterium]HMP26569.1 NAD-glutamate dehydrogenase [Oligoflexia bacterium]